MRNRNPYSGDKVGGVLHCVGSEQLKGEVVNERDATLANIVVLMLCTLPFMVVVGGIALLLGQPSVSATLLLWLGMVILIVILFGAIAVRGLRNARHERDS